MQQICKEAGLSAGGVYRYFPSKDAIIAEAFDEGRRRIDALFGAVWAQGGGIEALAALVCESYAKFDEEGAQDEVKVDLAVLAEAARAPWIQETFRARFDEVIAKLAAVFEAAEHGGATLALDKVMLGRMLLALYHGFLIQKLMHPELAAREYAGAIRTLLTCTLESPPATRTAP
jgi:AcrR family transcriptional regulator